MQEEEDKIDRADPLAIPEMNNQNIDTRLKLGEYIAKNKNTFPFELSRLSEDKDTVVIYLKHLRLGEKGAVHLSVLLNFFPRLQRLNLADNLLFAEGMNALSPSLEKLVNLEELHLETNFMREGARSLGNALKKLTKLQILNISDNEIDSASLVELSKGISNLTKLKTLKMSFNTFKSEGVIELSQALLNLKQLEILQLFCCQIESDGALALFQNFKECKSLKSVILGSNDGIASSIRSRLKKRYKFVHFGVEEPARCNLL